MNSINPILLSIVAAAALPVQAQLIFNPGATILDPPSATLGTFVASITDTATDDALNFKASLTTEVYTGGSNPLGGLSFVYTLTSVSDPLTSPNSPLVALGIHFDSAYVPASVDVNSVPGTGVVPSHALLSGATLAILYFNSPIDDGLSSVQVVIGTDATGYTGGFGAVIDGTSEDLHILVPVPEVQNYALLAGLGLVGFAIQRRLRGN